MGVHRSRKLLHEMPGALVWQARMANNGGPERPGSHLSLGVAGTPGALEPAGQAAIWNTKTPRTAWASAQHASRFGQRSAMLIGLGSSCDRTSKF